MNCACGNIVENRDTRLCASCSAVARKIEREALKPKKVKKPIKRVSKAMAADLKTYNILRDTFLSSKGKCEAKLPVCNGLPETVHHKKGRNENLLNVKTWLSCCMPCHIWITKHSKEAIELGLSESRLTKT